MALHSGARLGPYEVLALIGAGGMGEVYRARDLRLNREVAIKIIAADIAADPQALARFEREARAVARLSHPNILAIYDVGQQDGTTFAVMELLQGEPLRRRLLGGALPTRKAVEIATQIARGLAAAHEAGIVHRDLKPENVFLTADGQVKLLDFGLARPAPAAEDSRAITVVDVAEVTAPGTALGTPGYMAPEQVQGLRFDHRSDIFALGAVLYELLTGQRAFRGESTIDVMHAVLRHEPAPGTLADVPPTIRRIALRCLEKRPEDRFSSARDVGFALEAAGESPSGSGSAAAAVSVPGARRGRRTWAFGLVVALAVGAAAGIVTGRRTAGGTRAAAAGTPMRLQLPGPPGDAIIWAISPDGRTVAVIGYGALKPGPADIGPHNAFIWTRDLAGGDWKEIAPSNNPSPAFLFSLAWSPDAKFLIHQVLSNGKPELQVVDVASGAARSLVRVEAAGISWSRQSGILVGGDTLRLVTPATGALEDVLPTDAAVTWRRWPTFLADGHSFVFTQDGQAEAQRGIFLGQVGSTKTTRLTSTVSNGVITESGHLLYGDRGTLLSLRMDAQLAHTQGDPQPIVKGLPTYQNFTWFAAWASVLIVPDTTVPTALGQLVSFDRTGQRRVPLGVADRYSQIELSPDHRRLAVERDGELGVVDLAQGVFTLIKRAPLATGWFNGPVWSPDGRSLAAAAIVDGRFGDLVQVDVATREVRTLVPGPGWWPEAWSRDGKNVLVTRGNTAETGAWLVPVGNSGAARRLTPEGAFGVDQAQLSPEDRWLAYISNETGDWQVYVEGFEKPGERRRVSADGGSQPRWRDDGGELFYLRRDGMLMAVPVSPLMEPGTPVPLFTMRQRPTPVSDEYVVLPGGQRFVAIVPTAETEHNTLAVLTNWTSLLSR